MKQGDDIDKLFKDKLGEVDIPEIPRAYLDDINKRLDNLPPPKRKRRGEFFWLFTGLTIASFGLYYSFVYLPSAFVLNLALM